MLYHQSIPLQKNGQKDHYNIITALKKIQDKYNYNGMDVPADDASIETFEENNQVCIFIYEIGDNRE